MIAQDYLKMLPLSYAFEAPESPRIHFPTNSYEDILPNELLELSKTRAIVRSMQQTKDNNGWIIMDSTDLRKILLDSTPRTPPSSILGCFSEGLGRLLWKAFQAPLGSVDDLEEYLERCGISFEIELFI